jgi:thiamine biosynthesis lipoprotein
MKISRCFVTFILILVTFSCKKKDDGYTKKLEGYAFGTTFNIIYDANKDFTKQVDSLFHLVNKSLSTYISTSDISKINQGDTTVVIDDYFAEVYQKSLKIYNETDGIFDPTIGVLVNAWGFGPKKVTTKPDSLQIKELLKLVGFNKIRLKKEKVIKAHDSMYFDFNAIAKGYAVDIVGRFLEVKNVTNYLVEIGGEVRVRGINKKKNTPWQMGIEDPNFDGTRSIKRIVELSDVSAATSGNYRKFKIDTITGKKYAHILNTKTGYSAQNNLLSVTIIAKLDCADVDGYATALMAMSLEEATFFLEKHPELKSFLIYSDENGDLLTYTTSNF